MEATDLEPVYLSSEQYAKFPAEQFEVERRTLQQLDIKLN